MSETEPTIQKAMFMSSSINHFERCIGQWISVVQSTEGQKFIWSVKLDDQTSISGQAPDRGGAIKLARLRIDYVLKRAAKTAKEMRARAFRGNTKYLRAAAAHAFQNCYAFSRPAG